MTLDEAIKYCEDMAALSHKGSGNTECEQNHRQLAEWLRDYKRLKEQELCEDCISRKAALGCCRNEWEEEVEIRLKSLPPVVSQQKYEDIAKAFQFGLAFGFGEKHDEMDKVIEEVKKVVTPEKEFCEDAISRQAVLNTLDSMDKTLDEDRTVENYKELLKECYEVLTPVTPQPKMGRWMPIEYDGYADGYPVWDKWECSECGWEHSGDEESLTAFCPNCGTKMEVEDNG